jgi:hypothetical protein
MLRERFMVALPPDHPLANRPEVRLADLGLADAFKDVALRPIIGRAPARDV